MVRFGSVLLGLALLPLPAFAHAIRLEWKLQNGGVSVAAYYDDDTPASQAKVTVEGADKTVILEGRTDDRGTWTFPAPTAGEYTLKANAGDGHAAKVKLSIPAGGEAASDGPQRAAFTGPLRWAMTAAGLAAIAALTVALKAVLRHRRKRSAGEPSSAERLLPPPPQAEFRQFG